MKTPRLHNYELVKNTMLNYNESFLRKIEIAQLCGLEVEQVSRIIKAAWKLGWVSRIEQKLIIIMLGGKENILHSELHINKKDRYMVRTYAFIS